ncbi:MAG TPA: M28 family metallopeptidase [Acidisarcina sp.]
MPSVRAIFVSVFALLAGCAFTSQLGSQSGPSLPELPQTVFGYRDFAEQAKIDRTFLAVPDARLAGEELKTLTAAPHIAGSKEDYATAEYVAARFRAAGLETTITPYKAWLNLPREIRVDAYTMNGKLLMHGPTREHVQGDPFQDDPRVVMPFNGSSPSGDVTAEVVYANYGELADFKKLDDLHIDVRGKIVLVRYGKNFRGVKVYIAQQRGAVGVLIYSDPADDGYARGDKYPRGPYRPDTGVQRGSVQYMFKYPGDATTPGVASTMDLPDSRRLSGAAITSLPSIPSTPLSYHDAAPILEQLTGPDVPRDWQGALPFTYHVGPGGVRVHMLLKQDYTLTTIWDVIGTIDGTIYPDEWVVAGNHRDAWVYGAVDPNSGTAAMLEAVHGIGVLLHQGWKPKRRIVFASWDAEEEGLIGSTEWVEAHENHLKNAVAYFNTDVGVSGPNFNASAVPSLKNFVREVTKEVPSPKGGTVYSQWKASEAEEKMRPSGSIREKPAAPQNDVEVGDLGSGSDFTPFLQHAGVPSTDMGSEGPYGVYHSVFDNYAWFIKNADPTFVYEQQQARVFGLEVLHMADADVLPYDYETYGREIEAYLIKAKTTAQDAEISGPNFDAALAAARQFTVAAAKVRARQQGETGDLALMDKKLRAVEKALLIPEGLPGRPWFKHAIYAPGEYTGYAAVVIPGVNEAIDARNGGLVTAQLATLTLALQRATDTLAGAAN